jgi:hypothetical protein
MCGSANTGNALIDVGAHALIGNLGPLSIAGLAFGALKSRVGRAALWTVLLWVVGVEGATRRAVIVAAARRDLSERPRVRRAKGLSRPIAIPWRWSVLARHRPTVAVVIGAGL